MSTNTKTVRCLICDSTFTKKEIEGKSCCPNCKCKDVPCSISQDIEIKINWHELRILTIWASNWAIKECPSESDSVRCLNKIIDRLNKQRPNLTFGALTIKDEVKEMVGVLDTPVEFIDSSGSKKVVKRKLKN
jgi:hypothetical protein